MRKSRSPQNDFPIALRKARNSLGIPQDAFSIASSRTYISSLERGLKSPTLSKIDGLAEVLGVHPLTLLTLSYLSVQSNSEIDKLINRVKIELELVLKDQESSNRA